MKSVIKMYPNGKVFSNFFKNYSNFDKMLAK